MKEIRIKIGMFTTGHPGYWPQMPGIKDELLGYALRIQKKLESHGEVLYAGIVDNIREARKTEERFLSQDVDLVVIHSGTYGLSKTVLPCVRRLNVPILVLHLQPVEGFGKASTSADTLPKNAFSAGGRSARCCRESARSSTTSREGCRTILAPGR